MRSIISVLFVLSSCSNPDRDVVPFVTDCGAFKISDTVIASVRSSDVSHFVVSTCDISSGCRALFSYSHAPLPNFIQQSNGNFNIVVMGGFITKIHHKDINIRGGKRVGFNIKHIVGRASTTQIANFKSPVCHSYFRDNLIIDNISVSPVK